MSFKINSVEGTVAEIDIVLSSPSQHEREDFVIEEVKKAINHIVTALGGYLSVSCNGNINSVEGETGDVVNIYVTSLPNPNPQTTTAPESPPVEAQTPESLIQQEVAPVVEPTSQPVETHPAIQESAPSIDPAPITENPAEKAPEAPVPAAEPTSPITSPVNA